MYNNSEQEVIIHNIQRTVSKNIYDYRRNENLSLEKLSQLTGVSKTMLNQIEKGESNPTITTLWKIANGLHIPLTTLITPKHNQISVIDKSDITPIYNHDQSTTVFPYFLYEEEKQFEMFKMEIQQNGEMLAEGHHSESEIYIIVTEGDVELEINDKSYQLSKDQGIRFKSDFKHIYRNIGKGVVSIISSIQYK